MIGRGGKRERRIRKGREKRGTVGRGGGKEKGGQEGRKGRAIKWMAEGS